ncbi:MAG: PASTA domain-containing protein, partial [Actinomycetota bacterium]|nr:PASTA domain-containing protein [Actinomycetota bacterium]
MVTSRTADQLGRVLGDRYHLVAAIGRGGSGNVFLAEDVTLRRRVAVKLLHPGLAQDEVFLRRFRAEAQQAAALNHPNIMRVYDWGESEDGPYLVLEHLGGGSLRDLLDRGHRLSPSQALVVGLEAARGLDYAHRRGLVHRDIKPANLLFDDEGRLTIADFGIARALAEAAWTEPAGAMLGTARYASPEQAQGASLDGKADVYALALVLVEAVTGRVPFAADTAIATLMARVGVALEAPAELGPLAPIVEQAGAPEVEERLEAHELAEALDRAADALPAPDPLPVGPVTGEGGGDGEAVDLREGAGSTESLTRPVVYDADADAEPAPGDVEPTTPPRWRRVRPLWVALAILVALLVAGAAYAVARSRVPSHPVPALRGKTLSDARAIASRSQLEVRVDAERFEEEIPAGVVLDQDPALGQLREGSTIKVVVSKGPAPRPVPDLAGLKQAQAEERLRQSGFVPKVARRFHEDQPAGAVLDWSPRGDQPKGAEIAVAVSGGPAPRKVPDVAGRSYEEAARALGGVGLKATRAEAFSDTVAAGKVVGTRPPSGSEVDRDSTVTVVVSKGPDVVAVPNVAGRSVPDAQAVLGQSGLSVVNVYGPLNRTVFTTDPAAGAVVKRGAGVSL